ncbi:MAG: DUF1772 domain-containing protein, partial [Cytophagales bacterium]|nr:DUF1772 domain-containing protein [Cytophagales bacterium]
IGLLDDVNYLKAFQNMNNTILNPLFYIVIISPLFLSPLSAYLYKSAHYQMLWPLIGASVLYFLGIYVVTVYGNVPLNDQLDALQLSNISLEDAKAFRDKYEAKWNNLHLIRTISSSASFLLLIWACLQRNEQLTNY